MRKLYQKKNYFPIQYIPISEPREYICSFCKINTESAWSLVQHVQTVHGVQIYSENKLSRDTNAKGPRDLLREYSVPAMTISCSSQQQQQNGAKKTGFSARQFESLGLVGNGGSKSDSLSFKRYSFFVFTRCRKSLHFVKIMITKFTTRKVSSNGFIF